MPRSSKHSSRAALHPVSDVPAIDAPKLQRREKQLHQPHMQALNAAGHRANISFAPKCITWVQRCFQTHQRAWWLPRAQKGGMAGVPMTCWYCCITSSGDGPAKMYRSTRPPITLQQQQRL